MLFPSPRAGRARGGVTVVGAPSPPAPSPLAERGIKKEEHGGLVSRVC